MDAFVGLGEAAGPEYPKSLETQVATATFLPADTSAELKLAIDTAVRASGPVVTEIVVDPEEPPAKPDKLKAWRADDDLVRNLTRLNSRGSASETFSL